MKRTRSVTKEDQNRSEKGARQDPTTVANVNKLKSVPAIITRANKATKKIKVDNLLAKDTPKKGVKAKQTKLSRTDKQLNVQVQPGTSSQRSPVTYPVGAAFNVVHVRSQETGGK